MKFAVEFDVSHQKHSNEDTKPPLKVTKTHLPVTSFTTQMINAIEIEDFELLDALNGKKNKLNENESKMDRLSVVSNDQHGANRPLNFRRHSDWYYTHSDHKENNSFTMPYAEIKLFVSQSFDIDIHRVSFVEIEAKSYGYNFEFDILLKDMC